MKKIVCIIGLMSVLAGVSYAADPTFRDLIIPKDGSGAKYNAIVGYDTVNRQWQFLKTKKLLDGTFVLDLGTVTVSPGSPAVIKNWVIKGTDTILINPGQTKSFVIESETQGYYLSSINISGIGGDAKVTVILPSPHYHQILRLNPSCNITFDFGEGIKIDVNKEIVIQIQSTDENIGQAVDISWQISQ